MNKVFLSGRLGSDAELRVSANGAAILKLNLATSKRWKDKDGNQQEKTEWHRVSKFGNGVEKLAQYLTKGSLIGVVGELRYGSYEKDGVKHYTTDIVAEEIEFQSLRKTNDGTPAPGGASATEYPNDWDQQ